VDRLVAVGPALCEKAVEARPGPSADSILERFEVDPDGGEAAAEMVASSPFVAQRVGRHIVFEIR
jgi:hypothetical protein